MSFFSHNFHHGKVKVPSAFHLSSSSSSWFSCFLFIILIERRWIKIWWWWTVASAWRRPDYGQINRLFYFILNRFGLRILIVWECNSLRWKMMVAPPLVFLLNPHWLIARVFFLFSFSRHNKKFKYCFCINFCNVGGGIFLPSYLNFPSSSFYLNFHVKKNEN